MANAKGPKSTQPGTTVAKTVVLSLGMATITGKLKTVRKGDGSKPARFRTVCPECLPDGVPVIQSYSCPQGHGPFSQADCAKAKEVDGELVPFLSEEVEAVKAAPAGDETDLVRLDLRIHPAEQVAPYSRQTGVAYFFDTGPRPDKLVGVLRDILAEPDLAIMAMAPVKGVMRWLRLQASPAGLELVELARPEEVFAFQAQEHPYGGADLNLALALVDALKMDFDPKLYESGAEERLAAVLAAKADGTPIATVTTLPTAAPADNLEAALAASLAALHAGKAA